MEKMILMPNEKLFTEKRTTDYRKEQFEYIHTGIVDENDDMWTTTQLDEANLNQILNQYRAKYGIPFPQEIIKLRQYYGISAAKMSVILGFGINQYRYYEDGEVPNISNARTLVAIRDKNVFIEMLKASRNTLTKKEFQKIFNHVNALPNYTKPETVPSSLNGYISRSFDKLCSVMLYFIEKMGGVYITKMNKLLFYCDFLTYKNTGFGMTGLEYRAMQFGPVPNNWSSIYGNISEISMNECLFPDGGSGIKLESDIKPDLTVLSQDEQEILEEVYSRFKETTSTRISQISHEEKGWIENEKNRGEINYSYAFYLSM